RVFGAAAKTRQFKDLGGTMLVELRGDGAQTIFPPSTHPEGDSITWEQFDTAGEIATTDLEAAAERIAAAAILARHWPAKGSKHDGRLALAGGLLRGNMSEDDATNF